MATLRRSVARWDIGWRKPIHLENGSHIRHGLHNSVNGAAAMLVPPGDRNVSTELFQGKDRRSFDGISCSIRFMCRRRGRRIA